MTENELVSVWFCTKGSTSSMCCDVIHGDEVKNWTPCKGSTVCRSWWLNIDRQRDGRERITNGTSRIESDNYRLTYHSAKTFGLHRRFQTRHDNRNLYKQQNRSVTNIIAQFHSWHHLIKISDRNMEALIYIYSSL